MSLTFLSVCSGIEAVTVATAPLGWRAAAYSEIEKFPCALLKHRHPNTPNLGDMTKFKTWHNAHQKPDRRTKASMESFGALQNNAGQTQSHDGGAGESLRDMPRPNEKAGRRSQPRDRGCSRNLVPSLQHSASSVGRPRVDEQSSPVFRATINLADVDLLVGGTPCQSFSVAGLRGSLSDARGNLAMTYIQLMDFIDEKRNLAGRPPSICVWENVPGILSTKDNAFGCFLGALAGSGGALQPSDPEWGWTNAGYVRGPKRAIAWRIFDAQYFGVAQRRNRVFVVASAREGFCPAAVLLEPASLRWDSPPSRKAGERPAGTLSARAEGGGGLGTDLDLDGGVQVAHSLRADGFDASEDGTGRGTPLVPEIAWALQERDSKGADSSTKVGHLIPVAFDCKRGSEAGEKSPTLRAMGSKESHANAGGQVAVAFGHQNSSHQGASVSENVTPTLDKSKTPAVMNGMSVRRLTPGECEKLQGFSPGYTAIPYNGKPAEKCPDGPRYKALGNSMAVPCIRWIAERIQIVHEAISFTGQSL